MLSQTIKKPAIAGFFVALKCQLALMERRSNPNPPKARTNITIKPDYELILL